MLNLSSKNKFIYTSLLDLPKCESSNIWIVINDSLREDAEAVDNFYKESTVHFIQSYGTKLINEHSSYSTVATSFAEFHFLQKLNPEFIYISGDLIFNVDKLLSVKRNSKIIGLPSFPYEPIAIPNDNENVCLSFIDPHYIYLYDKVFDALDFTYNLRSNEEVLIKHYTNSTPIFGDMSLFIPFVNVDGRFLNQNFTESRMNCGRLCFSSDYRCKKCLLEQQIIKRKKEEYGKNNQEKI